MRNILTQLIKIILFLTAGNTALRGNERKSTSSSMNEGNFIWSVRLMAEFDPILHNLLYTEKTHKLENLKLIN